MHLFKRYGPAALAASACKAAEGLSKAPLDAPAVLSNLQQLQILE